MATTTNEINFTVINDSAVKVQAKRAVIDAIVRPDDKFHGGSPEVTRNGCWVHRGKGGWVTLSAFDNDTDAILADLEALQCATAKVL